MFRSFCHALRIRLSASMTRRKVHYPRAFHGRSRAITAMGRLGPLR
jgi:hypothetical protein